MKGGLEGIVTGWTSVVLVSSSSKHYTLSTYTPSLTGTSTLPTSWLITLTLSISSTLALHVSTTTIIIIIIIIIIVIIIF